VKPTQYKNGRTISKRCRNKPVGQVIATAPAVLNSYANLRADAFKQRVTAIWQQHLTGFPGRPSFGRQLTYILEQVTNLTTRGMPTGSKYTSRAWKRKCQQPTKPQSTNVNALPVHEHRSAKRKSKLRRRWDKPRERLLTDYSGKIVN
jgi:hypothetical protein